MQRITTKEPTDDIIEVGIAALKGYEEAIDEKNRLYVEKRELNEEEQAAENEEGTENMVSEGNNPETNDTNNQTEE